MKKTFRFSLGYCISFIILLVIEILIALFVHDSFIRPFIGDVLVVILLYCLIRTLTARCRLLPLWIFLFAAAVEAAQYFDIVHLLGVSGNRILSTVIGGTFDIIDIVCYACGCLLLAAAEFFLLRGTKADDK